ncbi:MAG: tetratricopeptide repeat protein [Armatimonadetes bacterium]|nr:tetratricopeptide repeat protein [Armatimonadota bacterium]
MRRRLATATWLICLLVVGALAPAHALQTADQLSTQAHAKYDANQLDEAEALFGKLLQDQPGSTLAPDAQFYLGWIAYKKGSTEAEARWQAVVALYPNSPEAPKALKGIAAIHYKTIKGDKDTRIADFQRIVDHYPTSPEADEARLRIGVLHRRTPPDFTKALEAFSYLMANAKDPGWRADAYVETGLTYLQRYWFEGRKKPDDLTKALEVFSSTRTKYPGQGEAVAKAELRQARIYLYSENDMNKAWEALSSTIGAYPETTLTTEILYHMAYCTYARKDYDGCILLCENILATRPVSDWNAYLQYFIGNAEFQAGRKTEAKAALEKTVALYPESEWARHAAGLLSTLKLEEE